ncbi:MULTISPECIES: MCE family protein [Mycolicibacterium]|uniref:MCE family protein n=1 Tax=Mycolicibacterium TaxID=1866885 RepID=UPI000929AB4C|nr:MULTISPECIES: MCE family protein [Mycolicibacterium]RUP26587.1 MAG: MCE family protein [Mycolicibacterium sp.]UCZ58838.1 MCE family protein [Mycolicibacterium phocaicum]SHW40719.1 MCE-family protein Mce6C [Mycobacteroides abscessus subsp. abscessus]
MSSLFGGPLRPASIPGGRKRVLEDYNKFWLGLIGLVVIVVMVVTVVLISVLDFGRKQYTAEFAQAAAIKSGNAVTIAGINVGEVRDVALAGNHVVVTFKADKNVRLGTDTHASIKLTTILGSRYLELVPGGSGQLAGNRIALSHTEVPYDLQKTLEGATSTLAPLDAERIAESVRVMSASLQGLPDALPEALNNLNSLAGVIQSRRDQLGTLITNADTIAALLHRQKADLGALVLQGNQILGEITSRRAAMQRLFDGVTLLADRVHIILASEPQLDALISNLHEFSKMLADHDALVRNILQVAPITVRNLTNATGNGNALELGSSGGFLVDSWMCAISGRARQFNIVEYFKDCK